MVCHSRPICGGISSPDRFWGDERNRNLTWRGKGGEGAHGVRVNACAIPWCVLACSPSLIPQPSSDTRRWQRASRRVVAPSRISAPVPSIFFKEPSRRRAKRHDSRWCKGDADLCALRSAKEIGRSGMAHTEFCAPLLPLIPNGPLPDHESPFLLLSIDTTGTRCSPIQSDSVPFRII
jgi:hypothetical protein